MHSNVLVDKLLLTLLLQTMDKFKSLLRNFIPELEILERRFDTSDGIATLGENPFVSLCYHCYNFISGILFSFRIQEQGYLYLACSQVSQGSFCARLALIGEEK